MALINQRMSLEMISIKIGYDMYIKMLNRNSLSFGFAAVNRLELCSEKEEERITDLVISPSTPSSFTVSDTCENAEIPASPVTR